VGRIGDPGLELDALEDAVAGQSTLGIVEPQDQRDQGGKGAKRQQLSVMVTVSRTTGETVTN